MKLTFAGCGDAFGSGGRFNTCFHVETGSGNFLIDCGASSLIALKQAGLSLNDIDTIILSHLHGDHFGGIPFFQLDGWYASGRTSDLTIAGPKGTKERVEAAREILFPRSVREDAPFKTHYVELEANKTNQVNSIKVDTYAVRHFSGAPSFALRIETNGKIVSYSGDTEWTKVLIPAADGADLFIMECYHYYSGDKFHANYMSLVEQLPELNTKRIVLTHLSEDVLARRDDLAWEAAHDGMIVEF